MRNEIVPLLVSIRSAIVDADRAVTQLGQLMQYNTPENVDDGDHADDLDEQSESIHHNVEKVFRETAMVADTLGLTSLSCDIKTAKAQYIAPADLHMHPVYGEFYSPALSAARQFFSSIEQMVSGREITGLNVLETILRHTPRIIKSAKLEPDNEVQVSKAVLQILQLAFVDATGSVSIPQISKNYKPDLGVKSLAAAIEYKFIDSEKEMKTALEGIYADMRGYSGHSDWHRFFAVLYMTAQFSTQEAVDMEFHNVGADVSWKPILVTGAGSRKKR